MRRKASADPWEWSVGQGTPLQWQCCGHVSGECPLWAVPGKVQWDIHTFICVSSLPRPVLFPVTPLEGGGFLSIHIALLAHASCVASFCGCCSFACPSICSENQLSFLIIFWNFQCLRLHYLLSCLAPWCYPLHLYRLIHLWIPPRPPSLVISPVDSAPPPPESLPFCETLLYSFSFDVDIKTDSNHSCPSVCSLSPN